MFPGVHAEVGDVLVFELRRKTGSGRPTQRTAMRVERIDEERGFALLRELSTQRLCGYTDGRINQGPPNSSRFDVIDVWLETKRIRRNASGQWRLSELVALADQLADASTGLVRVPDVVKRWPHGVMDAQATLLAAHRAGLVELRPESGVGLLSASDAALCPRGVRGVVLSWLRTLDG